VAQIWLFGFILLISLLDFWGEWRRHKREKAIMALQDYYKALKITEEQLLSLDLEVSQREALEQEGFTLPANISESDLQHSRQRLQDEIEQVEDILDKIEGVKVVPDLNFRQVLASIFWYLALAIGLFAIMLGVAYIGLPGGDLPAMIINTD
jgi:hypothetical protein